MERIEVKHAISTIEIALSSCNYGCKIYGCRCGENHVWHSAVYGCPVGRELQGLPTHIDR